MTTDAPLTVAGGSERDAAATGAVPVRRGLDRFELGLLTLFAALSMWVVGSDLAVMLTQGRRWTHTDGFFSGDQLQYLSWIQSSAHHGLISNLFVLRHTPADYFQPAIMVSGLLVRLGMSSWLSLMLWKPVAVIAIFLAVRALAAHCFGRTLRPPRRARPRPAVRLAVRRLWKRRRDRGHDVDVAVLGLSVRPDRGRPDHLRDARLRPGPGHGRDRLEPGAARRAWRGRCTRGRAS